MEFLLRTSRKKEYKSTLRNSVVIKHCLRAVITNSTRKWAGVLIAFNKRLQGLRDTNKRKALLPQTPCPANRSFTT